MSMFEAARLTDPIAHSNALTGFLIGAVLGALFIAAAAAAIIFSGGLCIGVIAAFGAGIAPFMPDIGAAVGAMFPPTVTGTVVTGSHNVLINNLPAARATLSAAACTKDPALLLVAEGSSSVFINNHPAARNGDAITCGAKISAGSANVQIGNANVKTELTIANEIPQLLRDKVDKYFKYAEIALAVTGLAYLAKSIATVGLRATLPCAGKMLGGFVAGVAAGSAGAALGQTLSGHAGRPVDVTTGRKILLASEEVDFVLSGRMPIVAARFYASNLEQVGMLGAGWRLPWELSLKQRDDQICYTDAQGREIVFPLLDAGQKVYLAPEQLFLGRLGGEHYAGPFAGHYLLITLDQRYFIFSQFDANGGASLQRIEDGTGARLEFAYNAAGQLVEIHNRSGQRVRLHWQQACPQYGPRLTSISAVAGASLGLLAGYAYDSNGNLICINNRCGEITRQFAYENSLMVMQRNAFGLECHYRWQRIGGQMRVIEHSSNSGEHYYFNYDLTQRITTVLDVHQRRARWHYDAQHQVSQALDFDGLAYTLQYNADGNITELIMPGQRQHRFDYDAFGRCTRYLDPLQQSTSYAWHGETDSPTLIFAADGHFWCYEYDARGLLTMQMDTLGHIDTFDYDEQGMLESAVDAHGGQRSFVLDARGNVLHSTDCSGHSTHYAYDADGALVCTTDALGQRRWIERDSLGRTSRIVEADHSSASFHYGSHGALSQWRDAAGRCQRWQYSVLGQATSFTDAMQRSTHYDYDGAGHLQRLTNPNQASYQFVSDATGRVLRQHNLDGVQVENQYAAGELVGSVLRGIDETGREQSQAQQYQYDALGRLCRHSDASAVTEYEYDAASRLLAARRTPTAQGSAQGIAFDEVRFAYDRGGRLIAEHSRHASLSIELDGLGHASQVQIKSTIGTQPAQQSISWLRYGSGHVHQISCNGQVVSDFERDALGREVWRSQGALAQHTAYDAQGRKIWQSAHNQEHGAWQPPAPYQPSRHDPLAPEALQHPPYVEEVKKGQIWQLWHYRANGELASQHNSLRGLSQYHYDAAGFLTTRESENGQGCLERENFSYDAAGNLERRSKRSGVLNNRLPRWHNLRFAYDGLGNLTQKTDAMDSSAQYQYDASARLTAVQQHTPARHTTVRFAYDALGRRQAKHIDTKKADGSATRQSTWFIWQGMRLLQEISSQEKPVTQSSGQAAPSISDAGNVVRTYLYDPSQDYVALARLDQSMLADGKLEEGTGRVYYFHSDQIGTPQALTDASGAICWQAHYSAWGKQITQAAKAGNTVQALRYQGQYADDEIGLHYNTFRYYDPDIGRFITPDPIGLAGGDNAYLYAPNPTGWVDPWGWININVGNEGPVKVHAYPGPNAGGIEHAPLHAHMTDGKLEVRVLMEDYIKKGKLVATAGDPYPGEPELTKGMKKALKSNLSTYQQKTEKIFKTGGCS